MQKDKNSSNFFKLSNGEKVIPGDLEKRIAKRCHYVSYSLVTVDDGDYPVALIFPNKDLLENPDYEISPLEGCFCPRTIEEMGKCLTGCLHKTNCSLGDEFAKVRFAAIIDSELSIDQGTLNSPTKIDSQKVLEKYKKHLRNLYGDNVPTEEEVYVIKLEDNK